MAKSLLTPIEQYVVDMVKKRRIELGYSQKALALEMEKSIGFIGDIESTKERAKYNLNHINELARVLKCSPRDFLPDKPL